MQRLRRDLERLSARAGLEQRPPVVMIAAELTRELEELIAALDARAPRVEHAGEAAIARDAAALRAKAVHRLAELVGSAAVRRLTSEADSM